MPVFRLDKYLADAGLGTRSEVKAYIKKGLVKVNGITVNRSDVKINQETDTVQFQNRTISSSTYEYYLLNKPAGYVSATKDNTAPTVLSLIESSRKDLFPVGRLDKDTEGLLLITNDGALSHRLLSPKSHVDKTYYAIVEGIVDDNDIAIFKQGVSIGDADLNIAMPARLSVLETEPDKNISYINVTIQEGKFHQVKRMFRAVGKHVIYLKRTGFGCLTLPEDLASGEYRRLTEEEIEGLHFSNLKC